MNDLEPSGHFLTYSSIADKQSPEAKLARMRAYVEWFAAPDDMRSPSTKKEFAEIMGVSVETLRSYEADATFQRMYMERVGKALRVDRLGDVLNALHRKATDHSSPQSVQAAKTLLDWMDKHAPREAGPSLRELSMEDLVAELKRRGLR